MNNVMHVFEGHVIGGNSKDRGWESVAVGWFAVDKLPIRTIRWAREMIADTRAIAPEPISKIQMMPRWQIALIRVVFSIRNLRNRLMGR